MAQNPVHEVALKSGRARAILSLECLHTLKSSNFPNCPEGPSSTFIIKQGPEIDIFSCKNKIRFLRTKPFYSGNCHKVQPASIIHFPLSNFCSLIPKMLMFILTICCLTTSSLPCLMDLTFQVLGG